MIRGIAILNKGVQNPWRLFFALETLIRDAFYVYNLHMGNEHVHFERLLNVCTRIYLYGRIYLRKV